MANQSRTYRTQTFLESGRKHPDFSRHCHGHVSLELVVPSSTRVDVCRRGGGGMNKFDVDDGPMKIIWAWSYERRHTFDFFPKSIV